MIHVITTQKFKQPFNQYKMKVSDIKCNGIGMMSPANNVRPFITTAISLFRMRNSTDKIMEMLPGNDDYYPGNRFSDNERVADRLCSAITEATINEYHGDGKAFDSYVLEGIIEAFTNSLSGFEMDILILEALRDCASADHWYKFEKEWD